MPMFCIGCFSRLDACRAQIPTSTLPIPCPLRVPNTKKYIRGLFTLLHSVCYGSEADLIDRLLEVQATLFTSRPEAMTSMLPQQAARPWLRRWAEWVVCLQKRIARSAGRTVL